MALAIPNTFAAQAGPIPLSQLDANFSALIAAFNSGTGLAGSYVGTLTGVSGSVTGTINYKIISGCALLWTDANILGTSNSATMTITGAPAAVQPTVGRRMAPFDLDDGAGNLLLGACSMNTSGTLTFSLSSVVSSRIFNDPSAFQSGANKGILAGWSIWYPL